MTNAAFILLCVAVICDATPTPRWLPIILSVVALLIAAGAWGGVFR